MASDCDLVSSVGPHEPTRKSDTKRTEYKYEHEKECFGKFLITEIPWKGAVSKLL